MKRLALIAALLLPLLTAGCSFQPLLHIKKVPNLKPLTMPEGKARKPIALAKVRIKLPRNTAVGTLQYSINCDYWRETAHRKIMWRSGRKRDVNSEDFTDVFQSEMRKANFNVVGDPTDLFDTKMAGNSTEIKLGAVILSMKGNFCQKVSNWNGQVLLDGYNGEAYLKVKWVVFSVIDNKVVYEKVTEGYFKEPKESPDLDSLQIYLEAFASSLNNLLADEQFMTLVQAAPGATMVRQAKHKSAVIDTRGLTAHPLPDGLERARSAVATVYLPNGHGSGFFISSDGFLLTNYHVAGGAKHLVVGLHSGRKVVAEVLWGSPRHDVALLKVGETGLPALKLATAEPPVGADVYCIGSPTTPKFKSTVSKGIVSAYRKLAGGRVLQSDLTTAAGNSGGPLLNKQGEVVGLLMAGAMSQGVPTGQVFFVPTQRAIRALGLKFPHGR